MLGDAPPHAKPSSLDSPDAHPFDAFASRYEELHAVSIRDSGESTDYFARYKLECLQRIGAPEGRPILDFGCGIGNLTALLVDGFREVHAFDPSAASLDIAKKRAPAARFHQSQSTIEQGSCATAVLSGVLHHVPPRERPSVLADVKTKLADGGRVVVFEHNPLNPLTRRAVKACQFDDDAVLLFPRQTTGVLREAGFADVELRYIVFFPRSLAFLRPLEPRLGWLFLGAQVMAIGTNRSPG